jgi:hypothetical protein
MHESITHTLKAAVSQMANCGCDSCMAAQKVLDPDGDGDIDIGSIDDPDSDSADLTNGRDGDMKRAVEGLVERILEQKLSPVYSRLQGIAGTLARSNATQPNTSTLETLITSAITRAVEAAATASESSLDRVHAELSAVKGQVDVIANTPMPGAPVMNASAMTRPVEKTLVTDPYGRPRSSGSSVADAVAAMSMAGQLNTIDKQVDAVAAALAAQRRG